MILTKAQARAAYDAMCALNNVAVCDGNTVRFHGEVNGKYARITVEETDKDVIHVSYGLGGPREREHHAGLAMFHLAYDL